MKKGDISWQMILLILAVIGLIIIGGFIIAKTNFLKDFFDRLISSIKIG